MKMAIDKEAIDQMVRLGAKNDGKRPVRLTVTKIKTKALIMANRKLLKGSMVYISDNFPKEVLEARKKLLPEMKKLRDEGKIA